MALKAGRVGVAPDQVDEFGKINSEATSGYTKQEADAKFETQTHAASTYETKSDAISALAEKQPILLSVPIEMLSGTKLTVEDALNGLAEGKVDNQVWNGPISIPLTGSAIDGYGTLVLYENVEQHIASLMWNGNGTAPDSAIIGELDIISYMTEKPVHEVSNMIRRGDVMLLGTSGHVSIYLVTQSWSSGMITYPTRPKS